MNTCRFLTALLALLGGAAALACEYPPLVALPAGDEATKEEMLEAQRGVQTYMQAMESYLACIDEELTAGGDDAAEEFKEIMFSRHNAAIAEMEAVAAHFNEELQLFRESTSADGE